MSDFKLHVNRENAMLQQNNDLIPNSSILKIDSTFKEENILIKNEKTDEYNITKEDEEIIMQYFQNCGTNKTAGIDLMSCELDIVECSQGNNDNSKNGKIDPTQQGNIGDCWLLSGVNALSYTEVGREIIKNALDYQDGSTIVHFYVGDYTISDEELNNAKAEGKYAQGDDDMIILELAFEKLFTDIKDGKLLVDNKNGLFGALELLGVSDKADVQSSILNGGSIDEAVLLLTGKVGIREDAGEKLDPGISELEESWLAEFQQNDGKDIVLTANAGIFESSNVEDINGKQIEIYPSHAYAIKNVTDDTITVVNPWDANEEIVLSRENFNKAFKSIAKIDLSDNNHPQDIIKKRSDIVPEDIELENHELYSMLKMTEADRTFAIDLMRKYPDIGKSLIIFYSIDNENKQHNWITVDDLKEYANGDTQRIDMILPDYLEESPTDVRRRKDTLKKCLNKIANNNSNQIDELYERIIDRHLILNPYIERRLSGTDIYYLSLIPDDKWDKAMDYLQNDPKLSGKNIFDMFQ